MLILYNRDGMPNASEISSFNVNKENHLWMVFTNGSPFKFDVNNGNKFFEDLVEAIKKNKRVFEFDGAKYDI